MAFFQEHPPRQPFLRAPPVVIGLILILIGAHAARVYLFTQQSDAIFLKYGFVPARYSHAFLAAHSYSPGTWFDRSLPFVTHMFLHGNWEHVLINSVWLLAFGPVVARRWGTILFLAFFTICGIAGAFAHLGFEIVRAMLHLTSDQELMAPVIGASGAISGLMAAGFRMLSVERAPEGQPLAPILSGRILAWTAIWTAVNIVAGVTRLGTGTDVQLVAWAAHLGGFAAGLVLAGPFDTLGRPNPYPEPLS